METRGTPSTAWPSDTRPEVPFPAPVEWPPAVRKPFRALVFDWDGTAVSGREQVVARLNESLSALQARGIRLVIVTGTRVEHILRQSVDHIPPSLRPGLKICTNRGSEVYGFDGEGHLIVDFRREATPEENRALDEAAISLRDRLRSEFGLDARIIFDRLNRRKIDLLPVPRWQDPKKSEFPQLLDALERHLASGSRPTGLRHLMDLATEIAAKAGLEDPRITSDIKHIEIGLTDKSDSIRWIEKNFLAREKIEPAEVLIAGDEFGPIGGVSGSDSLLLNEIYKPAVAVSFGTEPEGVPEDVLHIGGGPRAFWDFLDLLLELHAAPSVAHHHWLIERHCTDPSLERHMESLFTVGNGHLGARGAIEDPLPSSRADLYIAGIYDKKVKERPYSEIEFLSPEGRESDFTELVSFPFPFSLRFELDGRHLPFASEERALNYRRELDMRDAVFVGEARVPTPQGNVVARSMRAASHADHHLLLQEVKVSAPEGLRGRLLLSLDATERPEALADHPHLRPVAPAAPPELISIRLYDTQASGFRVGFASRAWIDGHEIDPATTVALTPGRELTIRRVVSVFTNRDTADVEGTLASSLRDKTWTGFEADLKAHLDCMHAFWRRADIEVNDDPPLMTANRFNTYHLLIATPPHSFASIGARTLSGRGYEGHVFWDTEVFILPFLVHSEPEKAKTLLMYRYRTLHGARLRARELGARGACFPWESTVNGEDVTPRTILLRSAGKEIPIFTGQEQIHVTADIAYAVSRYWAATGDDEFMLDAGAEILIETARFWASRCTRRDGGLHIDKVVGPDEYHSGVNDNAYTNWMARHNLLEAHAAVDWMASRHPHHLRRLEHSLRLGADEPRRWLETAGALHVPAPGDDGVIEQFSGFFSLEDYDLRAHERFNVPISRLFEWKEINARKIIKQADVLMLPFLFPERFDRDTVAANYRYYEPITDHGSSLSPPVHAAIAGRVGLGEDAWIYFQRALNLDLHNLMSNTALGVHAASMGGSWQALVFGLLGGRLGPDGPEFDPDALAIFPNSVREIRFNLHWRGDWRPIRITRRNHDESQ